MKVSMNDLAAMGPEERGRTLDALAHPMRDGQMYPTRALDEVELTQLL